MTTTSKSEMQELLRIVDEIHADKSPEGEHKCKRYVEKYQVIAEKYPMIFKKATLEANFDVERLKWMISLLSSVKDNALSKHEADIEVGEKLVDEHIKPLLNQ